MRRALKRKIKKKYELNYIKLKDKFYFPVLEKMYYFFFLSDADFNKKIYAEKFDKELDLVNPKTFSEKLIWLKIYDRTSLHTLCADKLAVREYVKEKIGEEYLIPLVFSTKNVNDLTPENLPNFPIIIKTNHDSGSTQIIRDKKNIDWSLIHDRFKKSLTVNYYFYWREWQYKNISPCIIIEKLLLQENGSVPYDYKLHCFGGKVTYIQVHMDRETKHTRSFYDVNWNLLNIEDPYNKEKQSPPPHQLSKMIKLAQRLSSPFTYVRIDFYELDRKIYFGEFTFHPEGGYRKFTPEKWNLIFGKQLQLPIDSN